MIPAQASIVAVLIGFGLGMAQGCVLGFMWRGMWDDWFKSLWKKLDAPKEPQ